MVCTANYLEITLRIIHQPEVQVQNYKYQSMLNAYRCNSRIGICKCHQTLLQQPLLAPYTLWMNLPLQQTLDLEHRHLSTSKKAYRIWLSQLEHYFPSETWIVSQELWSLQQIRRLRHHQEWTIWIYLLCLLQILSRRHLFVQTAAVGLVCWPLFQSSLGILCCCSAEHLI